VIGIGQRCGRFGEDKVNAAPRVSHSDTMGFDCNTLREIGVLPSKLCAAKLQ
jgi:hypothetical protein